MIEVPGKPRFIGNYVLIVDISQAESLIEPRRQRSRARYRLHRPNQSSAGCWNERLGAHGLLGLRDLNSAAARKRTLTVLGIAVERVLTVLDIRRAFSSRLRSLG